MKLILFLAHISVHWGWEEGDMAPSCPAPWSWWVNGTQSFWWLCHAIGTQGAPVDSLHLASQWAKWEGTEGHNTGFRGQVWKWYFQAYFNSQKWISWPNLTAGKSGKCSLAEYPGEEWNGFGQYLFGKVRKMYSIYCNTLWWNNKH